MGRVVRDIIMKVEEKIHENDLLLNSFLEVADELDKNNRNDMKYFPEETFEENLAAKVPFEDYSLTIPAVPQDDFADLYEPKSYYNAGRTLGRKRKSEDWDFKPGHFCKKQAVAHDNEDLFLQDCVNFFEHLLVEPEEKVENETHYVTKKPKKTVQKRTRWTPEEILAIWAGVEEYGNNWRQINAQYVPKRKYHQLKDKGRRLLAVEGWETGNRDCEAASKQAKAIATAYNKTLRRTKNKK